MTRVSPPEIFHVEIIMDGNGRWAKKRFLPRLLGHRAGIKALERTVRAASDLGITHLSVYAFSTENWRRPESEIKGLMSLFRFSIRRKVDEISRKTSGSASQEEEGLPDDVAGLMSWAEEKTAETRDLPLLPA